MTIEQALVRCTRFPISDAVLSLWVFKKRARGGFTTQSVEVTAELATELKRIVSEAIHARTEIEDYTFLAQQNEVSCLHVGADETSFADLKALVDQPAEEHRVESNSSLNNVAGYLIRLRSGTSVLYCVKQATDAWKTKKARTLVNVVFRSNKLELVEDQSFTIAKTLDFAVLDNDLFVFNKRTFESLLSYKVEYSNSFAVLQSDSVFSSCFADMQPLVDHVGTNTMHLRRMAVIQQRGHYADPDYMSRLQQVNAQEGWDLQFDSAGRIIATPDTMRVIMQVLLNHRLYSRLSLTTFDVPSTAAV